MVAPVGDGAFGLFAPVSLADVPPEIGDVLLNGPRRDRAGRRAGHRAVQHDPQSGIGPITTFDVTDLDTTIGGEIRYFDIGDYLPRNVSRRMDSQGALTGAAGADRGRLFSDLVAAVVAGTWVAFVVGLTVLPQLDCRGVFAACAVACAAGVRWLLHRTRRR